MVNYELILTDNCNRNCSFCYVKKTGYIETKENIQKFIDIVKKEQNENSQFEITFFGGEPILNLDGLKYVIESFANYKNCKLSLITNGDMIELLYNYEYLSSLHVNLTAYDIFTNKEKYLAINENLKEKVKELIFQYTFTENNIDQIDEFKSICKSNDIRYFYQFSHDSNSWKNISIYKLYKKIYYYYDKEFKNFLNNNLIKEIKSNDYNFYIHLKRSIQLLLQNNFIDVYCFTYPKKTFYKGNFIFHCIRFYNSDLNKICIKLPLKCIKCQYRYACNKGCGFELVNGQNLKICTIEKSIFNAIFQNLNKIENFDFIKNI